MTAATRADRLLIADVTLRDEHLVERKPELLVADPLEEGQWRMSALSVEQVVGVAAALARLRVDVVEAGFPSRSEVSNTAVRTVARCLADEDVTVSGLAPIDGSSDGIDLAWDAVRPAARPRLHVYSVVEKYADEESRLRPRPEILEAVRVAVARARSYTDDVEFSPPQVGIELLIVIADATRVALEEGATTINVRGLSQPSNYAPSYRELLQALIEQVPGLNAVTLSADIFSSHLRGGEASSWARDCAVAAVEAGCRQVKCALHGVAATPGFARLEELSLGSRVGAFAPALTVPTGIDHRELLAASDLVAAAKGYPTEPSDPLVGQHLRNTGPGQFYGGPLDREHDARIRAAVLREVGLPVPKWLEKPSFEWPLDPRWGP